MHVGLLWQGGVVCWWFVHVEGYMGVYAHVHTCVCGWRTLRSLVTPL